MKEVKKIMTKEEALALIEKRKDEAQKDLAFTQKKAPSQLQATKAILDAHSCKIARLYEQIEMLGWAYDLVGQIEVIQRNIQHPTSKILLP